MDARRTGSDHGFTQGQVLENAGRGVKLGEYASTIRNDAHVTLSDGRDDVLQWLRPQVMDCLMQTLVSD